MPSLSPAVKYLLLLLLCIPLLLTLLYDPASGGYDLQAWMAYAREWGALDHSLQATMRMVQEKMEEMRLRVAVGVPHECQLFVERVEKQQQIDPGITLSEQLCSSFLQLPPQQLIITVMTASFLPDLPALSQQLCSLVATTILAGDPAQLPRSVRDRLSQPAYAQAIGQQLRQSRYLAHCRYATGRCRNYVLVVVDWPELQEQYYQYGDVWFVGADGVEGALLSIATGGVGDLPAWRRLSTMRTLHSLNKQLHYWSNLQVNSMVTPSSTTLLPYLHQVQAYLSNTSTPALQSLLHHQQSVRVDIFPTQYKLGVYLPIILIFVVFPCASVLRL